LPDKHFTGLFDTSTEIIRCGSIMLKNHHENQLAL
jgi:hypothetical protein